MTNVNIDRRGFLFGAAVLAGCVSPSASSAGDETVIISDVHVNGAEEGPKHALARLKVFVDRLLEKPSRRVVVLGDHAHGFGRSADYSVFEPEIRRLERSGVEVVMTLGNHDRRESFFSVFPELAGRSPVAGFAAAKVALCAADLILIDSLHEKPDAPSNPGKGRLSGEQGEWLLGELRRAERPVIVAAHHPVWDMNVGKTPLARILQDDPHVVGYLHGHEHVWSTGFLWAKQEPGTLLQSCGVPSLGAWGDIGYAVLKTSPGSIVVESHVEDFFLPEPLSGGAVSPAWRGRVADLRGAKCTFVA